MNVHDGYFLIGKIMTFTIAKERCRISCNSAYILGCIDRVMVMKPLQIDKGLTHVFSVNLLAGENPKPGPLVRIRPLFNETHVYLYKIPEMR